MGCACRKRNDGTCFYNCAEQLAACWSYNYWQGSVSYTHLRAHETRGNLVCRLLLEKKELFDPNNIAALIDKSKIETSETSKKTDKITQDQQKSVESIGLSLSEEDALKAQIFGCWSIPLGLPYNENLLVRIKLQLNPDGTISQSEILDHARMNKPGQGFYKVLAESALRAIKLCQPLRVPTTGYERWKELQLNFDAREMLEG